jgi:glycosyltransferase involved in cell wall biosynthesis
MPTVTVLMPVYNGEKYLRESIESILEQTFTDFDFLIIDDGSTDDSSLIINSYNDTRIKYIKNEKNLSTPNALNIGLDLATGDYIARMDCDDISLPDRLAKQVLFMESNPDIGISGTWIQTFGELSDNNVCVYPCDPKEISYALLFNSVLASPSVIIRRCYLKQYNLKFNSEYIYAQDYNLWAIADNYFKLANIPEILLKYRISSTNRGKLKREKQLFLTKLTRNYCLDKFKIKLTTEQKEIFSRFCSYEIFNEMSLFYDGMDILNTIYHQSIKNKLFNKKIISKSIFIYYSFLLQNIPYVNLRVIEKYVFSKIFIDNIFQIEFLRLLLFQVKSALRLVYKKIFSGKLTH